MSVCLNQLSRFCVEGGTIIADDIARVINLPVNEKIKCLAYAALFGALAALPIGISLSYSVPLSVALLKATKIGYSFGLCVWVHELMHTAFMYRNQAR